MSDSIELSCYGTVFSIFISDNTTTVAGIIAATAFI